MFLLGRKGGPQLRGHTSRRGGVVPQHRIALLAHKPPPIPLRRFKRCEPYGSRNLFNGARREILKFANRDVKILKFHRYGITKFSRNLQLTKF